MTNYCDNHVFEICVEDRPDGTFVPTADVRGATLNFVHSWPVNPATTHAEAERVGVDCAGQMIRRLLAGKSTKAE